MKDELRICLFRSAGRGFVSRLQRLREIYPQAHLMVMLPKGEQLDTQEAEYVHEVLEQPHEHYPLRSPSRLRDLSRALRDARIELFIVMYSSPRLRLTAGLSGARRGECWIYENEIIPIPTGLVSAGASLVWRMIAARARYLRCWMVTYLRRVPMPGEVDKMAKRGPELPRR
ncbi:MAG: hypothetical protein ACLFU6_05535 [Candidatus Hydrogenedentota bacterium]